MSQTLVEKVAETLNKVSWQPEDIRHRQARAVITVVLEEIRWHPLPSEMLILTAKIAAANGAELDTLDWLEPTT